MTGLPTTLPDTTLPGMDRELASITTRNRFAGSPNLFGPLLSARSNVELALDFGAVLQAVIAGKPADHRFAHPV
jgi:hypothetical protein